MTTLTKIFEIPSEAPDEYKRYELIRARRDFAIELYDVLQGKDGHVNTGYNTIKITETIEQHKHFDWTHNYLRDAIWITAEITPVQYKDVVIAYEHPTEFAYKPRRSWLQRLFGGKP